MNKTLIGIAFVLLVAAVGYFLLSGNGSTSDQLTEQGVPNESGLMPTPRSAGKAVDVEFKNIQELIRQGEDLTCDFKQTNEGGLDSSGTVFISGENFRVHATTNDATYGIVESGMIFKDEIVYAWSEGPDGELVGFTFAATQNDVVENSDNSGITDGQISLAEEVDFSCTSWSVDESEFVPPSNIEFFDPSAMFMPPQQ